jgi:glutamate-1-semialdehyde 2,1-aminomutase
MDIMSQVAPEGPVYQAGTLSGNPLAMAAGIATLTAIKRPGFYEALEAASARLASGLSQAAENTGTSAVINRVGSMLGMFLTARKVENFDDAKTADLNKFAGYYREMLVRGIYLAPSQFEALFVSAVHTDQDIDDTIQAAEEVFASLASERELIK